MILSTSISVGARRSTADRVLPRGRWVGKLWHGRLAGQTLVRPGQVVMRGVQLSRHSAIRRQIHLAAQLHPQRLVLLLLQLRRLAADLADALHPVAVRLRDVEGSRALLHLDHVPRDVLLQRLGGDADAPRADEVLVLPAAVATDLPRLQVGDQRSVARPAVEQASETVDARPAVVRGSAALAPSNPISRSWVAARPPRRPTRGTRLLP